jgi:hypothetical protein
MAAKKRSTKLDLAQIIDDEGARLAGVAEILKSVVSEGNDKADSLGVCADVVDQVNTRVSDVAAALRRAEEKEARPALRRKSEGAVR